LIRNSFLLNNFCYKKLIGKNNKQKGDKTMRRENIFSDIKILAEENLPEGGVILDFGCGTEPYFANLRPKATWYIGVDIDPTVPEHCKIIDEYICVDLCDEKNKLPLGDGTVDLVVSNMVFEHLPKSGNVLPELVRVLKPGGKALISVPNVMYPVFAFNKILTIFGLDKVKVYLLHYLLGRTSSFPAYYRLSSFRTITRELKRVSASYNITWELWGYLGGFQYFRFSHMLLTFFKFYEMFLYNLGMESLLPYILILIKKRA
jgi:SAM-dependent methyltransferase